MALGSGRPEWGELGNLQRERGREPRRRLKAQPQKPLHGNTITHITLTAFAISVCYFYYFLFNILSCLIFDLVDLSKRKIYIIR